MRGFRTQGHPAAVESVARAIARERPPHALLLMGPAGIGKTTLALDLAAGLLCRHPDPAARPCRDCPGCRKVGHGNHPDLHRLAPEGAGDQIRLAQVQGLSGDLALLPMEGRWRVAVIEAAHRLNPDAQNALLKTLEEPVGSACIILAAADPAALLPTVHSRAARLRMGPLADADIAASLVERAGIDPARAAAVARLSEGRMGLALGLAADATAVLAADRLARSLLDLTVTDRRGRLGAVADLLADGGVLDAATRAASMLQVSNGGPPMAADPEAGPKGRSGRSRTTGDRARPGPPAGRAAPAERRRAAIQVLVSWRALGRDLAVAGAGGAGQVRHLDLLEELRTTASLVDSSRLLEFLQRLDRSIDAVEAYANPELMLDALVLAWPSPRRAA